jgi:nucleoside-diphosphate-sugar epimerase
MTTVLVTGASGRLGRILRRHLACLDGVTLRLLDKRDDGDADVAIADLAEASARWAALFENVDAVIHLAANSNQHAGWAELAAPNLDATVNLYRAAAEHGVGHVVLASSIWAAAGRRGQAGPIDARVNDPGGNAYGATKIFAERIAHASWRSHGIATTILRIGAVGAPGAANGLLRGFDAEARLSPRDLCGGVERALRTPPQGVRTMNLISHNADARFTLDEAEAAIGYVPLDHFAAPPARARFGLRRLLRRPGATKS